MTEPQPEYVWAFPEETPRRSRMWLMIGLAVAAIAVATAVVLAVVRPWETAAEPSSSSTVSPTPSVPPSSSPSASPTPLTSPTPSSTPTPAPSTEPPAPTSPPAPPAPSDPALPVFRDKVQPRLDDAATGLTYAQDASGEEGVQIADQLRDDAGRLSDVVPPTSIARAWRAGVQDYAQALDALRAAFAQGGSTSSQISTARAKLAALNDLIDG
ncbi:hypothetical protein AB0N59_09275 [Microbacterium sp. NPDC089321]|uniref:hypothetical protein n=1 Tax=Microbacterium sp. NPDC089321 TaxID=3155183 RepID=UPI003443BE9A